MAKAIITGADHNTQVMRLCMAIPRERDNDPTEMPAPSVCFSKKEFVDCYHYRVMHLRGELPVEQPEEQEWPEDFNERFNQP